VSGSVPPLDPVPTPGRSRIGWWWLLVAVLAIAVVTAVVAQPWGPVETEPTASVTDAVTVPQPTDVPSSPSPSVVPPAEDAVFDATTAPALFVTPDDLVAEMPAAETGVEPQVVSGQLAWGLPAGSTIDPPECLVAATVVSVPPVWYDARTWGNDAMSFDQEIVLLPDPAAAREAFRTLVTTVDACPRYSQVNLGVDGASWTAEPALEGQGVYPSIVQELTHTSEGATHPGYRGHLLVGNTIVTWTAQSLETGSRETALAGLGEPTSLSAMVEERAASAVQALG
jgi:hypothetical protein